VVGYYFAINNLVTQKAFYINTGILSMIMRLQGRKTV